jgi:hypothetical protein
MRRWSRTQALKDKRSAVIAGLVPAIPASLASASPS